VWIELDFIIKIRLHVLNVLSKVRVTRIKTKKQLQITALRGAHFRRVRVRRRHQRDQLDTYMLIAPTLYPQRGVY
jgi:hypothetical protein